MSLALLLDLCSAVLGGTMALAIAFKAKRSIPRWSFAAGMAVLALEASFHGFAAKGTLPEKVVYWETFALGAMSLLPGIWLLFSFSYGRGGFRDILRRRRPLLCGAFLVPVSCAVAFRQELIFAVAPAGLEGRWLLRLGSAGLVLHLFFLLSAVLVLMNLEGTFRASVGTMRWRIKFMMLGLGVLFTVRAYTSTQILLFQALDLSLQALNSGALLVASLLILRALFRTGQFEMTVYPSKSVLYNSFTVLLAGVYLIIVGVLAKVVAFLGGDASFELKAFLVLISLVVLSVLLLSDRVRLHTKRFVSRHFQRPTYDYRTVWRIFTKGTARLVEQTELCNAVVKLVSDIFEALSVAIWLVDDQSHNLVFAASTSFSEAKAGQLALDSAHAAEVIAALNSHPDPIDLDSSRETWTAALRRAHPDEFHKGGSRVCIPMIAAGELLGVLVLGDRVGGIPFSVQDLDLLKSVSDQVAASLLNTQLSQRLSQAKQMEAFQAMSAFFVHDLKNTASTLSLMLQNLPVHYQDPTFREDALRGISKTVTHINEVISRLTVLRHDLSVQAIDCDLNELVNETLKGQEQSPGVDFEKDLHQLPKLRLDPPQIQKVITNLVLNAREALAGHGKIRIETSQRNGWAVLAVRDNGCGMTSEFIRRSLFRPFKTTKQKGIGIGMFHCKMIIEAHHGRIEVESEPGKGTAFRVLLPMSGSGAKE